MYQLIAQQINNPVLNGIGSMSGDEFFGELIPLIITIGIVAGIAVFIFWAIISAISWITSGGDKAATQAARESLTRAIIGVIVLLSLFAIVNLIELFFGVNLSYINLQNYRINQLGN